VKTPIRTEWKQFAMSVAGLVLAGFSMIGNGYAARPAAAAPNAARLTLVDLARARVPYAPIGGIYDHRLQQMTGGIVPLDNDSTTTGGGEDDCCQSTTFWDGESS
jgi:hypothetical protein